MMRSPASTFVSGFRFGVVGIEFEQPDRTGDAVGDPVFDDALGQLVRYSAIAACAGLRGLPARWNGSAFATAVPIDHLSNRGAAPRLFAGHRRVKHRSSHSASMVAALRRPARSVTPCPAHALSDNRRRRT
jgi:hypothetical protein